MKLELYQEEGCPFCKKVRRKMTELGVSYVVHNPRQNESKMSELMEKGGKNQVPFLVVKGDGGVKEKMYESDEIIDFLEKNYS